MDGKKEAYCLACNRRAKNPKGQWKKTEMLNSTVEIKDVQRTNKKTGKIIMMGKKQVTKGQCAVCGKTMSEIVSFFKENKVLPEEQKTI